MQKKCAVKERKPAKQRCIGEFLFQFAHIGKNLSNRSEVSSFKTREWPIVIT